MNVVAIIPARDEADTIAETVRAVAALPQVTRVVVIDDASRDATAAAARAAGAQVVTLPRNVGKGDALEAGLAEVEDAEVVLLLDGDLGESAAQAASLLAPVLAEDADMSVAMLPPAARKAGFGLVKALARRGIARQAGGFDASAPLSGQRALSRRAIEAARPFGGGFGVEVTTTVRVLRAGLRVVEVPTTMSHRATGRDLAGFAHRGRQFAAVLRALAMLRRELRRD